MPTPDDTTNSPATASEPLTPEGLAALLDRPDPLRANGDIEADFPLHAIDPAPWNPKTPIAGTYRRGLIGSIGEFSLRARLIVWPNPRSTGRVITLDGNQRLDVIREMAEDYVASHEAARRLYAEVQAEQAAEPDPTAKAAPSASAPFDPTSKPGRKRLERTFEAVQADVAFMAQCRADANNLLIPCRVLSDLSRADAELFTASFDRSHAKVDEAKQAALVEKALAAKEALGDLRETARKRIEAMTRPERPFIAPTSVALPPPVVAVPPPVAIPPADPAAPAVDADGDEMPWGAPPPPPADPVVTTLNTPDRPTGPFQPPNVVLMFTLTAQGANELQRGILLSTQRMVRSARIKDAVDRFVACSTEADLSDVAVEVALICLQRRLAVAEQDATLMPA